MTAKLHFRYTATGATLYAVLRNSAGQVVKQTDGSVVDFANANLGDYDFPLTETPASSYRYAGEFACDTVGWYAMEVSVQAGGSPALTDLMVGVSPGYTYWDGSDWVEDAGLAEGIADILAAIEEVQQPVTREIVVRGSTISVTK